MQLAFFLAFFAFFWLCTLMQLRQRKRYWAGSCIFKVFSCRRLRRRRLFFFYWKNAQWGVFFGSWTFFHFLHFFFAFFELKFWGVKLHPPCVYCFPGETSSPWAISWGFQILEQSTLKEEARLGWSNLGSIRNRIRAAVHNKGGVWFPDLSGWRGRMWGGGGFARTFCYHWS